MAPATLNKPVTSPLPSPKAGPSRLPPSKDKDSSLAWLLSDDEVEDDANLEQKGNSTFYGDAGLADEDFLEIDSSPPMPRQSTPPRRAAALDPAALASPASPALSVPYASSPAQPKRAGSAQAMPPPNVPLQASFGTPETPQLSFPVGRVRKRAQLQVDSSPPEADVSRPRLHRLQHKREIEAGSSPLVPRVPKRQKRRRANAAALRAFVDDEAGHSGDEVSTGSSGADEPESESDRRFLRAPPETQVPAGYAQTQVYRESLATQVPGRGPAFAARPVVRGKFGPARTPRRAEARGSSPATDLGSEPDQYSLGSFVVNDEEEIVYEEDSSQLQL
jgi:ATP-dependent DNA helicase MPH1